MLTATAATNASQWHPATDRHACTSSPSWAFARPEKRTVAIDAASAAAVANTVAEPPDNA
jgi:hypothetical protein